MTQQQVYYRKWRPQRFGDVVGQEHITQTLRQSVARGRIAHAYLFCGPRGTGKTSTARIMAKAINCLHPIDGDPDDTCRHCLAISEGRFLDLVEMDAASNGRIDDARNIRDKVRLAPSEGKYKIYLLDEAHMLTNEASNALLKTLEEPPPHIVFILCTTDPEDLPVTIVSRCQRYDFRRLGNETVIGRLAQVSQAEGLTVDTDTLRALARAAGGSLRDAESLLEQLTVSYGNTLTETQVRELLGLVGTEHAVTLVKHLAFADSAAALTLVNKLARDGADLRQLHRQTVETLRALMLLQAGAIDGIDLPPEAKQELSTLAMKVPPAQVLRTLKLMSEVDLRHDAPSPLALELAVVESCLEPAAAPAQAAAAPQAQAPVARAVTEVPRPTVSRAPPVAAQPVAAPSQGRVPAVTPPIAQHTPVAAPVSTTSQPATTPTPSAGPVGTASQLAAPPARPTTPASRAPVARPGGVPASGAPVNTGASAQSLVPPGMEQAGPEVRLNGGWDNFVKLLDRGQVGKRFKVGGLLRSVRDRHLEGATLMLSFSHKSHAERWQSEMEDPGIRRMVAQALERLLGTPHDVRVLGLAENGGPPQNVAPQSPLVRAAMGLGARVVEEVEGDANE